MWHMTQYIRFHQLRIHVSFKIHRFEMMQFSPMFTQEPAMFFFSANEAWLLFWQLPDSAASNMISSSTVLRQRLLTLIPLYYLLASPVETFLRGWVATPWHHPKQCGFFSAPGLCEQHKPRSWHPQSHCHQWSLEKKQCSPGRQQILITQVSEQRFSFSKWTFYHRHVTLLIELEYPINACCQHVSTMSMMLDYCTTSVQRITERGMFIDFSTASSTYLFINTAPWRFTFPAAFFCTFLSFKMSHVTLVLASHVPTLYFLYEGLKTQFSPMITCLPQAPTHQGLQRQPLTIKKEP